MPLDNPVFLIPVLTGLVFVLAGILTLRFPPKKINSLYGYRTPGSMKNQEHWDFAQRTASYQSMRTGAMLALTGSLGFVYHPDERLGALIGIGLLVLAAGTLVMRVESALKKKFT